MADIEVPASWQDLVRRVGDQPASVVIVGAVDIGKSTLAHWLGARLAESGSPVWLIDADVGQPRYGPPAAVCCARLEPGAAADGSRYFVGDTSPRGVPAQTLGALAHGVREAREADAAHLVVNTTGWITGPEAVALKCAKAALLGTAHVVLLEASHELRAHRRAWRGSSNVTLHGLRPVSSVRKRSPAERRERRERLFREHLTGAVECAIDLREAGILGASGLDRAVPSLRRGALLGLEGAGGRLLSIGILLALDADTGVLSCLARPEGAQAATVRIGNLYLRADGAHEPLQSHTERDRP